MQDQFWKALILKDAPRPAVLAGQHSMYLFTDENGQAKTVALDEQNGDFATYQWLDSDEGQPADPARVYLADDSQNPRFLSGGNLLLVNGRTVLDVRTLEAYPFDKDSWDALEKFGHYYTRNDPARALSPDKKQLVFVGSRSREDNRMEFEYALVVADFAENKVYAVPFDQTDTRFESVWDATRTWLDTYFEWTKDASGAECIRQRKLDRLPPWQGRLHIDQYAEKPDMADEYNLFPVRAGMLPKFLDFLKQEFDTQDVTLEPVGENTSVTLTIGGVTLKIYAQLATEKSIGLYLPTGLKTDAGYGLLRRIGERFNEVLATGKYQEDFGRYD